MKKNKKKCNFCDGEMHHKKKGDYFKCSGCGALKKGKEDSPFYLKRGKLIGW